LKNIIVLLKSNYTYLYRFITVGAATFLLNLSLVWLFYGYFLVNYQLAISYAYVLTTLVHFLLNRSFTFGRRQDSISHHSLRYAVMLVFNYCITFGVTTVLVNIFKFNPYFSVVSSTICIALSSFLLMRYFVFSHSKVNL